MRRDDKQTYLSIGGFEDAIGVLVVSFGKKLKALREECGISQETLALDLGFSRQIISFWENDQHLPGIDKLQALCEYFHVSSEFFLNTAVEYEQNSDKRTDQQNELSFSDVKNDVMVPKKAKTWKIIRWISFTVSVVSILMAAVFILLNIDFESGQYHDYQYWHGFNWEPEYIALYFGIVCFISCNIVLFIISIKKTKRGNIYNENKSK